MCTQTWCLSCSFSFSGCYDKFPDKGTLGEEGFIWAHSRRDLVPRKCLWLWWTAGVSHIPVCQRSSWAWDLEEDWHIGLKASCGSLPAVSVSESPEFHSFPNCTTGWWTSVQTHELMGAFHIQTVMSALGGKWFPGSMSMAPHQALGSQLGKWDPDPSRESGSLYPRGI